MTDEEKRCASIIVVWTEPESVPEMDTSDKTRWRKSNADGKSILQ